MRSFVLAIALITATPPAMALQDAVSISTDFRIREVPYDPNEVFKIDGHFGYSTMIEFEAGEDVKTVSLGDSTAWQVIPTGNKIFLKPIESNPQSNMTVVTSRRVYQFEMHGKPTEDITDPDMTFVLRFVYPGANSVQILQKDKVPIPEISENPSRYNMNYTISGPERTSPIRIFDDGEFTYFQFRDINADIPAFFKVDSEGREAIINYRTVGDYIVVERVSSMFTLRHGRDIVCVFNESLPLELLPDIQKERDENSSEQQSNYGGNSAPKQQLQQYPTGRQ